MSDIVERLRDREKHITAVSPYKLLVESADEITRLRSELANARNTALEEAATIVDGVRSVLDQSDGDISHARPFFKDCLRDISEAIRRKAEGESR
jgi:hypothetical protein